MAGLSLPQSGYGMPVQPSRLTIAPWSMDGAYTTPGLGALAAGNMPSNMQPTGASWVSDIPVTANCKVAYSQTYSQYLEASDLLFSASVGGSNSVIRRGVMYAFNLYTINHFLRDVCRKARALVEANAKSPLFARLLKAPEWAWDSDVLEARNAGDSAAIVPLHLEHMGYMTAAGVRRMVTYLGCVASQPNNVTSAHISEGSMSARDGNTQVAWVERGPAYAFNVWGPSAVEGKHLWLQLKLVKDGTARALPGGIKNPGVFQFVPYVADDHSSLIETTRRKYIGMTGYDELCYNIYVGQMVARGNATVRDAMVLAQAAGSMFADPSMTALIADTSLAASHEASKMLEVIQIAVFPQRWGRFVHLA
jgi:hypothetical protein